MKIWTLSTCNDGNVSTELCKTEAEAYAQLAWKMYPGDAADPTEEDNKRTTLLRQIHGDTPSEEAKEAIQTAAEEDFCETDYSIEQHTYFHTVTV